jgi:hypothetical protein
MMERQCAPRFREAAITAPAGTRGRRELSLEPEPSPSSPEPDISVAQLWVLRLLAVACVLQLLWNARHSGFLAAILFAVPYLLGTWWLKPGTLRRGLITLALAGVVVGSLAFFSLVMAAAVPAEYFDPAPGEAHSNLTSLKLISLTQAALVIAAARAYFRTGPRPPV